MKLIKTFIIVMATIVLAIASDRMIPEESIRILVGYGALL